MSSTKVNRRAHRVKRLYQLGSARWYDPFRWFWTRLTSQAAEAQIDYFLESRVTDGCRVLDIGCGTGYNLGRLCRLGSPFASYRGVDVTDAMLAVARARYPDEVRASFEQGELQSLRGDTERFDLVLCTWVASHLERPREVLDIAYELLAPSGWAFLLMMTRPQWYVSWWFTPLAHLFQTRFVDLESLGDLRGLEKSETWAAGLVTLVTLHKATASGPEAAPTGGRP